MKTSDQQLTKARQVILPYTLTLLAMSLVTQLLITVTGNEIGLLAGVCTAIMALLYAAFLLMFHRPLARVRFGYLVTHMVTYAAVVVPYTMHFFITQLIEASQAQSQTDIDAVSRLLYSTGWFGVVIAMPACWGVGLHMLGALPSRGYEADS